LAGRHRVPFIVDLRDPWRLVERLPEAIASPVWLWLAAWHEREVVDRAALVVMNTRPACAAMQHRYPDAADRTIAVSNGFDADAVSTSDATAPIAIERRKFVIAYAGTIYLDRDPSPLFRAVARAIEGLGLHPSDLAVEFMGEAQSYDGVTVESLARTAGVEAFVGVHPRGARSEAFAFLARAGMLVVLPQDSTMAVPAKLFDYMQFDAAVLALASAESATAQLLAGTNADVVAPSDIDGIARIIARRFQEFAEGGRPRRLADHRSLSREMQAGQLFDFLDEVAALPPELQARGRIDEQRLRETGAGQVEPTQVVEGLQQD
ncbi:MAG TPA: hypothetical protein VMW65_16010, partial [Chloroflexota bacterium]|nr:hypothetical protein [Chloroflexota bacterium]